MALNFPNNPATGDQYTAEGVTYQFFENRWIIDTATQNAPVEIVEADTSAGWQVWGDTLIQWGSVSGAGERTITFAQPFEGLPSVTIGQAAGSTGNIATSDQRIGMVLGGTITPTSFACWSAIPAGSVSGSSITWFAVGEAPDALKKPKEIGVAYGGSVSGVPEAPEDGVLYGRKDADWEPVPTNAELDQRYVRNEAQGGGLVTISTGGPSGGVDGDIWFTVS